MGALACRRTSGLRLEVGILSGHPMHQRHGGGKGQAPFSGSLRWRVTAAVREGSLHVPGTDKSLGRARSGVKSAA